VIKDEMIKEKGVNRMKNLILLFFTLLIFSLLSSCNDLASDNRAGENHDRSTIESNRIDGKGVSALELKGRINIKTVGKFDFEPDKVDSVRKDIFREGHFSVFDILVHLDGRGDISMVYHFEPDMNTYVIDSINGKKTWWYVAFYDGGWSEQILFRMDHFPYKDRTSIKVFQVKQKVVQEKYDVFHEEVDRKMDNDGRVIVPKVIISGTSNHLEFENVEVKPHNLRSDVFQDGVITAIDTIMSLGDAGKLSYDLAWYDSIGSAGIVKQYFVERIDEDESYDRCGFVYEAGPYKYRGFQGNHIHLPSDTRLINSPEYVEYFWICI
jgi:hypothetical protein